MSRIMMSLSGGLDSTALLSRAIHERHEVETMFFNYGSKHNKYERQAAINVAKHFQVPLFERDLSPVFEGVNSNLLLSGGPIPEGHYEHESMSRTVVPARNMVFLSALTAMAISRECEIVWIGVHSGDHVIYPDCRPEFIHAMTLAIREASENSVSLEAPFLFRNKIDIVATGLNYGAPFGLTRTCYKDQWLACGLCGSCTERLEAFTANQTIDPCEYSMGMRRTAYKSR